MSNTPPDNPLTSSSGSGRRRRRSSSSSSSSSSGSSRREVSSSSSTLSLDGTTEAGLRPLIITGWIVALTYLPSGLLHATLGDIVYARDLALLLHLFVSLIWLGKLHQIKWVAKHNWFILLTPALLLPAMANSLYAVEALRITKWSFAWLDWMILGHFVRLDRKWHDAYDLLLWLTFLMMGAELAAGLYDGVTGDHIIKETWGEKTAFGVSRMFDETIGGRIRIRGLQRDVFSFANIMGANAVAAMAYLTVTRKTSHQLAAVLWALVFGAMVVLSGGRSAIFGVLAAFLFTVGIFAFPRVTRQWERRYVLIWVVIALALSLIGVGRFTDFIGSTLLSGSFVGDSQSAFMRDDYWSQMRADFAHAPAILVIGGPLTALLDSKVDPIFHWADNQFLWNAYHLGLLAALAFVYPFYKALQPDRREDQPGKERQALILFLVFVIGEGIARESLNYIGALPLFFLCGYESASTMLAGQVKPALSPLRRASRSSSSSSTSGTSRGNRRMKVLLRIRSDVDRFPGGDYQQLLKTRDALERLGVQTRVAPGDGEIDEPVDVVHLFNTTRIHETAVQFEQARRRGVPVVVSPIWHSRAEMKRFYQGLYHLPFFPLTTYFAAKEFWYARRGGLRWHPPSVFRFEATQRRVLADAQAVLPNSEVELKVLKRETGVTPAEAFVIPFGFDAPEVEPLPWTQRRDVICAGRIEPRKNQLAVIEAFHALPDNSNDRLLLYGAWNESHTEYTAKVRAALEPGRIEYGGLLPQRELHAAFGRAKAVVLASFFETFGMVALEAIACGANVCVSDTEYTRGFYGDRVHYCDPYLPASIREGLAASLRTPPPDYAGLLARFSWEDAARKTLAAYRHVTGI